MQMTQHDEPYWRTKTLAQMDAREWEALCDGCGRCCLIKLVEDNDEEVGPGNKAGNGRGSRDAGFHEEVHYTDVACRLLDLEACRCGNYECRTTMVPDCLALNAECIDDLDWLPPTCGYRLVAEGRDLMWWHPLISGSLQSVHDAGISVRGKVVSEDEVDARDLEGHIVTWPVLPDS